MPGLGVSSYEVIPYSGRAFRETHPDTLAAIASLFGMKPPEVARARVLEIGCGVGANLIPMAAALAEGSFLGIDQSERQVAQGRAKIEASGLRNVSLRPMSVEDAGADLGTFDYIICHGVYSWVAPAVQQKILALMAATLAPNGVAYVSYNLFPGWHMRGVIRDSILFHVDREADPREAIRKAHEILDFLVQFPWGPNNYYLMMIQQERAKLVNQDSSYILHEYLEEVNQPLYFHQFLEHVAARGLKVVADTEVPRSAFAGPEVLQQALARLSADPFRQEQYFDLLSGRMFRRSVLCHDRVAVLTRPSEAAVETLQAAFKLIPGSLSPHFLPAAIETLQTLLKQTVTIDHPLIKSAVLVLGDHYPGAIPFGELWRSARARLTSAGLPASEYGEAERRRLTAFLLHGYCEGWLELHSHPGSFVREPGERPATTSLARHQALSQGEVVNLRHEQFDLPRFDRHLLALLDGRRTREDLVAALDGLVTEGRLTIRSHQPSPLDAASRRAILEEALHQGLVRLGELALLVP